MSCLCASPRTAAPRCLLTRFLRPADVPALLVLEARQWSRAQAADAATLNKRIEAYPQLCVGVFRACSGEALASLFMKPTTREAIAQARCWSSSAELGDLTARHDSRPVRSLFGVSLTSVHSEAAWSLLRFFWPYALRLGCREIYLGSPMPGLRHARQRHQQISAEAYAHTRRGGLPLDPQLRYYHSKGFREIVAVRPGYFPHEASLDHAAVLRGRVPLAGLAPLWRHVPLPMLQRFTRHLTALL